MTTVPLAPPQPLQRTSLRIHISAPSSRKDDDRYRGIACAYGRFEPAKRVKLVEIGNDVTEHPGAGNGTWSAESADDGGGARNSREDLRGRDNGITGVGEQTGEAEYRQTIQESHGVASSAENCRPGRLQRQLLHDGDELSSNASEQPGSPAHLPSIPTPQHSPALLKTPAQPPKSHLPRPQHSASVTHVHPPTAAAAAAAAAPPPPPQPIFIAETPLAAKLAESQILTSSLRRDFEFVEGEREDRVSFAEEAGHERKRRRVGSTIISSGKARIRAKEGSGNGSRSDESDWSMEGLTSSPPGVIGEYEELVSAVRTSGPASLGDESRPQHRHSPDQGEREATTAEYTTCPSPVSPPYPPNHSSQPHASSQRSFQTHSSSHHEIHSSPLPPPISSALALPPTSSPIPTTNYDLPTQPTHIFPPSPSSSQTSATPTTPTTPDSLTQLLQLPALRTLFTRLTRLTRDIEPLERGCWVVDLESSGWADAGNVSTSVTERQEEGQMKAHFWSYLSRFIAQGRAGWDVTLGLETNTNTRTDNSDEKGYAEVRLYAPASKMESCLLLLWVGSGSRVGRLRHWRKDLRRGSGPRLTGERREAAAVDGNQDVVAVGGTEEGGAAARHESVEEEVQEGPRPPPVRWEDDSGRTVVWVEPSA
ncbi:MAG: hypothetical protein M1831_007289 [Alyxoria varia]|nr:MAG: hypothetical protein M1831_007289 [Alyxoria varia]